jgi:diadenosine tetraphosphate (Ap4A) HIT family hydrolase
VNRYQRGERFSLAPKIENTSRFTIDFPLSQLRLMNDARFPWLLLIPRVDGLEEWTDLDEEDQAQLSKEIGWAVQLLRLFASPDKTNLGSLGNIVRQLHIHVIARMVNDAAWPGPVWSHGDPQPYAEELLEGTCRQLHELARGLFIPLQPGKP